MSCAQMSGVRSASRGSVVDTRAYRLAQGDRVDRSAKKLEDADIAFRNEKRYDIRARDRSAPIH